MQSFPLPLLTKSFRINLCDSDPVRFLKKTKPLLTANTNNKHPLLLTWNRQ